MNKNICIVAGARPNFIKVAPVIRAIVNAQKNGQSINYSLVYAGCEDDPTLEDSLFDDLEISRPDIYLGVDCENLNELTGQVMSKFELYLQQNPTDVVIVVDDLASTMLQPSLPRSKAFCWHILPQAPVASTSLCPRKSTDWLSTDCLISSLLRVYPTTASPTRRAPSFPRSIWWAMCSSIISVFCSST